MSDWWQRYIGIPYARGRREMCGADCYGLAALIYEKEKGIVLPEYEYSEDVNNLDTVEAAVRQGIELWTPIEAAQRAPFDLVLIRFKGTLTHLGILVDGKRMVHTQRGILSCVQRYDKRWARRIEGFYRWEHQNG